MASERATYQARLRALGAYLDGIAATSCSVIETDKGFVVRWRPRPRHPELQTITLSNADLLSFQDLDLRLRRSRESQAEDAASPRPYQDIFRALGSELDQQEAAFLILDEVDGSLLVSYYCLNRTHLSMWEKQMTVLDAEAQERLVQQARGQRAGPPSRGPDSSRPKERAGRAEKREARDSHSSGRGAPAVWVPGERERYRTVVSRAWFGAEASYRRAELIVTTRQMIVRAQDHSVHRTPLETITEVHSQVDRQLLSSAFRVTISRRSGPPIKLECTDAEQMAAVAQQLEKVLVSGPVSPR